MSSILREKGEEKEREKERRMRALFKAASMTGIMKKRNVRGY